MTSPATKTSILIALGLSLTSNGVHAAAQDDERDPFLGNYRLGTASEITMMRPDLDNSGQVDFNTYDYLNLNNPELLNQLQLSAENSHAGATGIAGDGKMDIITGDFDGDDRDDLAAAWEGPERSIILALPEIDRTTFAWTQANAAAVPGALLYENPTNQCFRWLRMETGSFDDDPADEFVLAYWDANGKINLNVFDTDGSRTPAVRGSIAEVTLSQEDRDDAANSARFAMATGDLDGDGTDEIIVAAGQPIPTTSAECTGSSCWRLELFFYDYDATSRQITPLNFPEAQSVLYKKTDNSSWWLIRVGIVAGDFDGDGFDEVAVGYENTDSGGPQPRWYLTVLEVAEDLSGIGARWIDGQQVNQTTGNRGYPLTMRAADVTGNGSEELLYSGWQLRIYGFNNSGTFTTLTTTSAFGEPNDDSHRSFVVADLDADNSVAIGDTAWSPEIVQAHWREMRILVSKVQPHATIEGLWTIKEVAEYQDEQHSGTSTTDILLNACDLGNNGIRLGKPQKYTRTDIVNPIVILNAPPTHFDRFDGTNYDISYCYDGDCAFASTYSTQTERSVETSTTFNSDWSVGAKVEGGFTIPKLDVGVKVKLETKYGQGFSKRSGSRETFTVSQTIDAIADDWIYAVVADYDIWEYPIYSNNTLEGYVSVVVPKTRERAWFDSKSFSAYTYIPAHEVGNVLSYQEITSPGDNSALDVAVRYQTGDRITLNNNSSATWTLTQENQSDFSTANSERLYLGGSVDFNIPFKFIPDVSIEGDYSQSSISTYSSSVTDRKGLGVHFSAIDLSAGNTRYAVTPYAYWAKNGALVLDYAVKPELPPTQADPATWWSQRYGQKPDVSFILPWKLDPEKGLGLSEEAQRYRTRDIVFDPVEPKPGEVVTIKARIQNYSILPTVGPVKVRFYVGDPHEGGQLIQSIVGQQEVFTTTGIVGRGTAVVQMQWQLPNDIDRFSRIYAVLDPDNQMDEIHENNNKGWSVLFVSEGNSTAVETDNSGTPPAEFALRQNYPNPFNPSTRISYNITRQVHVRLSVYNLLGQEVARLVDRTQAPGTYTAVFQAGPLSSGLYFYRLHAGDFDVTGKMLLQK